jgi:hypothetical protein
MTVVDLLLQIHMFPKCYDCGWSIASFNINIWLFLVCALTGVHKYSKMEEVTSKSL